MEDNLLKTCLHGRHVAAGAQMAPFAGYDMPIQYTSIIDEHNAVRTGVGMFDVSHMGEILVSGRDAVSFLDYVFSNDVASMQPGKVLYGMFLNNQGGVVDDLLVYREYEPEHYFLVVNAANIGKDFKWLQDNAAGFDVSLRNESGQWGEIAVQGPLSERTMTGVLHLDDAVSLSFYTYAEMQWKGRRLIVSRTGYTGEDGFELYSSEDAICEIWDELASSGVVPCGLGCRDTLRFEAGLPLYGHELADDISPLEAGLGSFVKLDKGRFIGKEATAELKASGLRRKIAGIELDGKAVARAGYAVEADGEQIGTVTTGYRSITLDRSICMALLNREYAEPGTRVGVHIRKKIFPGSVCKRRFYAAHYKK